MRHHFDGDDAVVAYAETRAARVAAGPPIAPPARTDEVTRAFIASARRDGKRPRFFAVEGEHRCPGLEYLHIGEQPWWDPGRWHETVSTKKSLREQLRRARAKGVAVRELDAAALTPGSEARREIDGLADRWRADHHLPPMGFIVELDLYRRVDEKRFLVAERAGRIVGVLVAIPIYEQRSWFFEDVLRDPAAPNGTVELLFDAAMRLCAAEDAERVTFGLAPLAGVDSNVLATIRDATRWFYDFGGLYRFKAKLAPQTWESIYLAYPEDERGILAVLDSLRVFARGSLLRFAMDTLVHNARLVTGILAVLLLPWTLALVLAPSRFFPSETIRWMWITYDIGLFAMLIGLLFRWRHGLATALACLAGIDLTLGCVQLLAHNLSRIRGITDAVGVVLALAAPAFACIFLWRARHR